jgi:HAD superfamily hydrolase (TIGR01509 family)
MTAARTQGPAAVLLDLDGTLVDTVAVWHAAYVRLAAELDVALADGFWPSIAGRGMHASLSVFGSAADAHDPDELVARLVAIAADDLAHGVEGGVEDGVEDGWHWLPGARELLGLLWADTAGPATGLVTSAWRAFTVPLLDAALADAALRQRGREFDAVVCGDDVLRSKPDPDPYLRAAELLGVDPADCLVIEDSPTGVAAAEAAGMVVLAVPHAGPVVAAAGREVRPDLVGLTPADLVVLHARLRSGAARRQEAGAQHVRTL